MSRLWAAALAAAVAWGPVLPGPASAQRPAASAEDDSALRLLQQARRLRAEGDLVAAARDYQLLLDRFPDSAVLEQGLLETAELHFERDDRDRALRFTEQVIDRFPRSPSAAAALALEGEILASGAAPLADLEQALVSLRRVPVLFPESRYPNLDARTRARVRMGEISLRLGDSAAAGAAFLAVLEDEAESSWTDQARFGWARVLLEGELSPDPAAAAAAAADELQQIVDAGRDPDSADRARRILTLIHRTLLRPTAGVPRWQVARTLQTPGLELKKGVGLAASDDGRLVLTDEGLDRAVLLGREGTVEDTAALDKPGRPWFHQGEAYVPQDDGVRALSARAGWSFVVPRGNKSEPVKQLLAGGRGSYGGWFVLDRSRGVLAFDPAGAFAAPVTGGEPIDLVVDHRGRVDVLDKKAASVTRFSRDGRAEGTLIKGSWDKPQALAVDGLGHLYVLDRGAARIEVFNDDGVAVDRLGPRLPGGLELRNPVDLAVDGSGRIYVLEGRPSRVVVVE